MLYDDSKIEVHIEGSRLLITERNTWKSLLRLFGLPPLVLGLFVLTHFPYFVLFSGSVGLAILGYVAILALGISPTWMGLDMLVFRRAFALDTRREILESSFLLLRWEIWVTTHDLLLFDRIQLDLELPRKGGGRSLQVSCRDPEKTLPLVSFKNRAAAELFAEQIAHHLQLPLKYDRPHPNSMRPPAPPSGDRSDRSWV